MTYILEIGQNSYSIYSGKKLGEGAYGDVYEGVNNNTGRKLAIKIIRLDSLRGKFHLDHEYEKALEYQINEAKTLIKLT